MKRNHNPRGRGDNGAALVELAIVMPILFLIIFAIIEFGWGFAQYLDLRHGAREGARLAAVNFADPDNPVPSTGAAQTGEIIDEVCERMSGDVNGAQISLRYVDNTARETGDEAVIEATAELDTLTGFLDFALGGVTMDNTVSFRLEQDADWAEELAPGQTC